MKYFLDHNWQKNMQTPKKKLGEKTKINSLIIIVFLYLIFGLINHAPWRPLETNSFSIFADIFFQNNFIAPSLASVQSFHNPHIYELSGAIFAKIFFFLEPHNAARLCNILWLAITMICIGLANRELRGFGYGRQSNVIFLSSVGLFVSVHSFSNEIAILAASSISLYSLALSNRRPFRASVLLCFSLVVGIFSKGLIFYLPILGIIISLSFFNNWNSKRLFIFSSIALIGSFLFLSIWLFLISIHNPDAVDIFLNINLNPTIYNLKYYLINILWFAWPAIPLFFWTIYKEINTFIKYKRTHLPLIFIFWFIFILIIEDTSVSQIKLMVLLPAISLMASTSIDKLQRGASSAFNWFGIIIFSFISIVLWIGWFALQFGMPYKIYEKMLYLSGNFSPEINLLSIVFAFLFLSVWIYSLLKNNFTNRSVVTNWGLGIALVWITSSLLWFPMIENRKNYGQVFNSLKNVKFLDGSCLNSNTLRDGHIDLIFYYTLINVKKISDSCNFTIYYKDLRNGIENHTNKKILWQAKMPKDKKTFFITKN